MFGLEKRKLISDAYKSSVKDKTARFLKEWHRFRKG